MGFSAPMAAGLAYRSARDVVDATSDVHLSGGMSTDLPIQRRLSPLAGPGKTPPAILGAPGRESWEEIWFDHRAAN